MSHKILSFDVGIKNLAYCVLEKTSDQISILKWGIIDVIDSTNKLRCCGKLKPKRKNDPIQTCGNLAVLHYKDQGYCKTHSSQHQPLKSDWKDNMITKVDISKPCEHILSGKHQTCGKNGKYMCNEKHYCKPHIDKLIKDIEKSFSLKKVKITTCKDETKFSLSVKLKKKLDEAPKEIFDIDHVLIELQPQKNGKMGTVSDFLYNYCVGVAANNGRIQGVSECSASNKLKYDIERTKKVLDEVKVQGAKEGWIKSKIERVRYEKKKELAIIYTKELLEKREEAELKPFFDSHKKQDDLADALLMGYHHLGGFNH